MHLDYINRDKIELLAYELSSKGKLTIYSDSEEFNELSFATQLLLLSDVFIMSLWKKNILPEEKRNELLNKFNTQAQQLEREHRQHCEFCRRQIETVNCTNELRVLLTKSLNKGEFDKALSVAVELVDLYCSGIAQSTIYKGLLDKAKEKINSTSPKVQNKSDSITAKQLNAACKEIVNYFNKKAGTRFEPTADATKKLVKARLGEGRTVEDFKKVIDNMCVAWKGTKMQSNLKPSTLFRQCHFEEYLNGLAAADKKSKSEIPSTYDLDKIAEDTMYNDNYDVG